MGFVLGGSWVAFGGVITPLRWDKAIVALLVKPLKTTPEPPVVASGSGFGDEGVLVFTT